MNPCHTTIYKTNQPIGEAHMVVAGNEPTFTAYGGYHDAGDADRRTYHMDVTATLLTTYEAFPKLFTDEQFNIPDKFDEKYNILGKGNGIPDILDEAESGTCSGSTCRRVPARSTGAPRRRGTLLSRHTTRRQSDSALKCWMSKQAGFAAGMFMHLARLIKPYKPQTRRAVAEARRDGDGGGGNRCSALAPPLPRGAEVLADRRRIRPSNREGPLNRTQVPTPVTYQNPPESFAGNGWLASFFYSYIIENNQAHRPGRRGQVQGGDQGGRRRRDRASSAPMPTRSAPPLSLRWWGSDHGPGTVRLSLPAPLGSQRRIRSILMRQASSWITIRDSTRSASVTCAVLDSTGSTIRMIASQRLPRYKGWGPRPGILVFGPERIGQRGVGSRRDHAPSRAPLHR